MSEYGWGFAGLVRGALMPVSVPGVRPSPSHARLLGYRRPQEPFSRRGENWPRPEHSACRDKGVVTTSLAGAIDR